MECLYIKHFIKPTVRFHSMTVHLHNKRIKFFDITKKLEPIKVQFNVKIKTTRNSFKRMWEEIFPIIFFLSRRLGVDQFIIQIPLSNYVH